VPHRAANMCQKSLLPTGARTSIGEEDGVAPGGQCDAGMVASVMD
jgi:hypothetical protein